MKKSIRANDFGEWWEKPGLGIMYQIEARPGWIWDRDFDKFNASMKDEKGNFRFNGPFCKIKDWVEFSNKVGVDYHIFEVKWHDGICYFDTKYTKWKTPTDYSKIFAEESKKANIPFMFYYSSVFDHNPQFDEIQPLRKFTPSYIALHREKKEDVVKFCLKFTQMIVNLFVKQFLDRMNKGEKFEEFKSNDLNIDIRRYSKKNFNKLFKDIEENPPQFDYNPEQYEKYLENQMIELIENYKPDGMWMDWYMNPSLREGSTELIMDLMEKKYPNVILTFNNSINENPRWCHYLSGEAHTVESAWKQGNVIRKKKKPWELVGPAAKSWFDPSPRTDPQEIGRIATIIMANGGKFCLGLPSQMSGSLYPEPTEQLAKLGKWYNLRRSLFVEAVPMDYKGKNVPGIILDDKNFGVIGNIYGSDNLIHIINFTGIQKSIKIEFSYESWKNIEKIILEPINQKVSFKLVEKYYKVEISENFVDKIDTILRIKMK